MVQQPATNSSSSRGEYTWGAVGDGWCGGGWWGLVAAGCGDCCWWWVLVCLMVRLVKATEPGCQ